MKVEDFMPMFSLSLQTPDAEVLEIQMPTDTSHSDRAEGMTSTKPNPATGHQTAGARAPATEPSGGYAQEFEIDLAKTLARMRRRALDVYHHRPRRLWIAVNGIPVGSLDVCNKKNDLSITTRIVEPLQFIEVFSEQNVRLAMLNADPSDGAPVERKTKISLSDRRKLKVSFKERSDDVSIRLTYIDPEIEGWEILEWMGLCCAWAPA